MAYTGIKVHLYNTTAALILQATLDPTMARRTTKGDCVLGFDHCGLRQTSDTLSDSGSPREAAVSGACPMASRRLLPYPYTAIACGDAETAHIAVRHRVLLPTPLRTHVAPIREEAMHIQIELDFIGPRV